MKNKPLIPLLIILFFSVLAVASANAQRTDVTTNDSNGKKREDFELPSVSIKTNLLYDLTTTLNLGFEFRVGGKTSIELPFNYNPWQFRGGETKIKHFLVQPEFRWWPQGAFRGNFFGIHGHYAFYNVGGLPHGPFTQHMRDHRFQGHMGGAGVSWGYRWNFNHRWGLEVTLGIGYAYLDYHKYTCQRCGEELGREHKHYFGPTKAGVTLILGLGKKKKKEPAPEPVPPPVVIVPAPEPIPEPEPVIEIPAVYSPVLTASFVTPAAEPVKARSESGKAYLQFNTGRSEIVPTLGNNSAELQKIYDMVRTVATDPDVTITRVLITGHSSPDGSYNSNMTLSHNRAQALRDHISTLYSFDGRIMQSYGAGEDWATLDSLLRQSNIAGKEHLINIARGTDNHDIRERKMMAIMSGSPHRRVRNEIYPKLRRTDYELSFTVAPIGVERGKEVLKTRPGNLSLNEMFLISETYAPGSPEFNEVFDIAARVFPDSDVANLNAAASALGRKDAISAQRYLERVKAHTPEWWNNMGVLAWLQGDKSKAEGCFRRGEGESAENLREMEHHISTATARANAEAQVAAREKAKADAARAASAQRIVIQ